MKKLISFLTSVILVTFGLVFPSITPFVWATTYPTAPIITAANFSNFDWPTGYAFYTCTNNYYVAKTGSDSNNGTSLGSAWLTINHGISALQTLTSNAAAGYCLNINDGTYTEATNTGYTIGGSGPGTNGWFVIRAINYLKVISIVPSSDAGGSLYYNNFEFHNASYIWIEGIDIEGQNSVPLSNDTGVTTDFFSSLCSHITVTNSIVANHGEAGIAFNRADYYVIEGNYIYNNSWTSTYESSGISGYQNVASDANTGPHSIIANNVVYNNQEISNGHSTHTDGNGIILDDARNTQNSSPYGNYTQETLIENNVVFGNGGGGIHIFSSDHATVRHNTSYNNYIDTLNTGTWRGDINADFSTNDTFVNNISQTVVGSGTCGSGAPLACNTAYADWSTGGGSGTNVNTWYNNISYNGTPGQASLTGFSGSYGGAGYSNSTFTSGSPEFNQLGINPLLTNLSTNVFTLQAGSPAIGAGTNAYGYPPVDLNGNILYANNISIGAYQYLTPNPSQWYGNFYGALN